MKLKDFLQGKKLQALEGTEDLIINILTDKGLYGLDVDTSEIPGGTVLTTYEDFTIEGDIIKVSDLELDTDKIEIMQASIKPL
jgi:hypothetical protein